MGNLDNLKMTALFLSYIVIASRVIDTVSRCQDGVMALLYSIKSIGLICRVLLFWLATSSHLVITQYKSN